MAMGKAYRDQSRMFANLGMHENRLLRERERVIKQLVELQAERRKQENYDLLRASRLLKLHKSKGVPYNPADDGFVFSTAEIKTYIPPHDRYEQPRNTRFH